MITEEELSRLSALTEMATPGPWKRCGCGKCALVWAGEDVGVHEGTSDETFGAAVPGHYAQMANATFIAEARTAVPLLVDEVRRLTAELARADAGREALRDHGSLLLTEDELAAGLALVCPGCHVVNAKCAPGCIDAEIAAERQEEEDLGPESER